MAARRRLAVPAIAVLVSLAALGCSNDTIEETIEERIPTLPPITALPAVDPSPDTDDVRDGTPLGGAEDQVLLSVGDDIQSVIDTSPEGTVFAIASGVHRLQEIQPKSGMTFEGLPGAVLSGAITLDEWEAEAADSWRFDGIAMVGFEHGVCIEGYEGCRFSQDLYIDDVMLWQVTELGDLGSGRWYWEGETIYIADDPTARRIELSVASYAFSGSAEDVTIRGLVVEKYAIPAQFGAVQAGEPWDGPMARNWLIEDTEIRLNHGAGLRTGEETVLRRVFVHDNGQLGITASEGSDVVVEDSEISHNNIAGFESSWEAGGAKFTETVGLVVRRNFVHDNDGPGLWTDINNYDTLYESNVVTDNAGPGIFHEVSYAAIISDNTVTGNGSGWHGWMFGSGILVAASSDVEIYDNTVSGNAGAIGGIQQDREDGPEGPHLLENMYVHDNTISVEQGQTGIVEDTGDDLVFTDRGNRFESNTYLNQSGRRYNWLGRDLDAGGWQDMGQDLDGTWQ